MRKYFKVIIGLLTWVASFNIPASAPVVATVIAATSVSCDVDAQSVLTFLTKADVAPPDNFAKVYLMAGQSNMSGAAETAGLDVQYTGQLNAYIYSTYGSGTNIRGPDTQSWQRLELDKNNNNEGINGVATLGYMGPELVFGKKMSDIRPDRIFIIKVAYSSSTRLGQGGSNDWRLDGAGSNYTNFVTNSVINGLNEIVSDFGLTPDIRGFIWYQGEAERDGVAGYPTAADLQAAEKLQGTRIIQSLIDDIVEAGYDTKNMRISWGRIHNSFNPLPNPDMLAAVRAADTDIGTNLETDIPGYSRYIAGVTYINSDGYNIKPDNTHLSQTGQISYGTDLFNYFSTYIDEVVTVTPANTTGFDSDAEAFISAAGIVNQTQANAVNSLVLSFKSNGNWSQVYAAYPFVGGNRKAHKTNLKDPSNVTGHNLTFNRGFNHSSAGFFGNGANGYADTNIPFNLLGQNTAGLFYYTPTTTAEGAYGMGVIASGNASRLFLPSRFSDNRWYSADMGLEFTGTTGTDGSGFYALSRTSSTNYNVYIKGTKTSVSSTSAAPDGTTFTIGARNTAGTKGSFSAKTFSFFGLLNQSITDADELSLRNSVTTFQGVVR